MTHGRKVMWPIWALLTPVILVAVYFVAYLALVTPEAYYVEQYRFGGDMAVTVFRPLAACDQVLFPKRWESGYYFGDNIEYFPPGPEFKLSNEAADETR